jgi:hypothetical protein
MSKETRPLPFNLNDELERLINLIIGDGTVSDSEIVHRAMLTAIELGLSNSPKTQQLIKEILRHIDKKNEE